MSSSTTLLFSALVAGASSFIYGYVGARLGRRPVAAGDARMAWKLFTIWWWCLSAQTCMTGILNLIGSLNQANLPLFVSATYVSVLLSCAALWGLLSYLLYLFTGSRRVFLPLTVFYIAYGILLIYYVTASAPNGVRISRWSTTLTYNSQLTGPLFVVVVALLLAPHILAALAYFTVCFRVRDPTLRYRIVLISWSIIIWFGSPLVALASGQAEGDGWQVASKIIGLFAASLVLGAYLPPHWVKARFGVASIADESA